MLHCLQMVFKLFQHVSWEVILEKEKGIFPFFMIAQKWNQMLCSKWKTLVFNVRLAFGETS